MKIIKNQIVITCCLLAIFASCKKDDIPPIPKLTPVSSFSMEFNDFQQDKSAKLLKENWLYSVMKITIFNSIVSANMVIPTIAFTESFNHTPTFIGDMTWQWSYDIPFVGTIYTAKLNGITQKKQKVKWEMYIDKAGANGFTNFLWFEGTTTDSTSAIWTVYENTLSPSVLFDIEWESNAGQSKSSLKYTYRNIGSLYKNSTIEFGKNTGNVFDRNYNIFLSSDNTTITIEWNSETKNGRVKSPNYYKDENWHCWDEHLFDAWCD